MSAVAERAARQRAVTQQTVAAVGGLWSAVVLPDLEMSWARLIPAAVTILTAGQRAAASGATRTVVDALLERGADPDPVGEVVPGAFAGVASDGRPLETLLFAPPIATRAAQARGAEDVLLAGRLNLSMLAQTQVADASRTATGVAMVTDRDIAGHERVVHLPACGRCIILAGRLYRWSEGFARHPRCDCTMEPVTRDEWRDGRPGNTPEGLFGRMTGPDQDRAFGKAGARAIRDGADPAQVVNARRGMRTASVHGRDLPVTTTGTTRRGLAGRRLKELRGSRAPRLMPEAIYSVADDREHAIRLLRLHGYIT